MLVVFVIVSVFVNELYEIFTLAQQQHQELQGTTETYKRDLNRTDRTNATMIWKHNTSNSSSFLGVTAPEVKINDGGSQAAAQIEQNTTTAGTGSTPTDLSSNRTTIMPPIAEKARWIHRFCGPSDEASHLFDSPRLIHTQDPDRRDAWWVVECMGSSNAHTLANQSMIRRIEAHLGANYTGQNLTKETMDEILGDWRIILFDYSDKPSLNWMEWFLGLVANVVTWERVYFVTRSTTMNRWLDNRYFKRGNYEHMCDDPYLGRHFNYTTSYLGKICAGAKRFHFSVRGDIFEAFEKDLPNYLNEIGLPSTMNRVDLPRPKDAVHFWDMNNRRKALLRCEVSRHLMALNDTYPERNLTLFANIVGNRGKLGRTTVNWDYVRAMLEFKIVVVAQRDRHEDHYRLFEALISGAMVMSDPAMSLPYGVVHNETIILYRSMSQLQNQIIYYLDHPEERLRIARAGLELALNHHLGRNRYEDIILGDWDNRDEWGASILRP